MWVFNGEEWIQDDEGDGWPRVDKKQPMVPIDVLVPELQVQIVTSTQRPAPPPPPM